MSASKSEITEPASRLPRAKRRAGMIETGTSLSAIDSKKPGTKAEFISAYLRLGSVSEACAETCVRPWRALPWLQKANLLRGKERIAYGTAPQRYGREAENDFQRLVPDAIDCNSNIRENNPAYDFVLHGLKIDVKSGAPTNRGRWSFNPERSADKKRGGKSVYPDVFVFFAMTGKAFSDGYHLFLFPAAMVLDQTQINISPNGLSHWWDFQIDPDELDGALGEMAAAL